MRSAVRRQCVSLVLAVAVAAAVGCKNNDSSSSSTSTAPSTFIITETFTGTLMRHGAVSFSFGVQAAGTVNIKVSAIADTVTPSNVAPNIGFSLGTWDGAACAIQTGVFVDNASVGAEINGTVTGAGTLCARVYDPASFITNPLSFTLTITHP